MDFKNGDRVRIKKDGALAVVTHAVSREGRKQERVEVKREDNGSVYSFWFDELEIAGRAPAADAAPAPAQEPDIASGGKRKAKASG